jgi:hypothetical protein
MTRLLLIPLLITLATLAIAPRLPAQDTASDPNAAPADSQQVEESDEAFRRRMELEDARHRDPAYVDPQDGYQRQLEKIDRLPEASRDNIREQLIDIILENGEWSPEDARREYPYRPSAAAREDAALASREQEAWDEQIEKYHAREAAAFGAYRGPASGPGNPDGAEGGAESSGDGGEAGAGQGQGGQQGESDQAGSAGAAGTYEPYRSDHQAANDAASTAGVSESALEYLRGRQAQTDGAMAASAGAPANPASRDESTASDAEATARSAEQSEDATEADENTPRDLRGILAIEDLDKLGDSVRPPPPEKDKENPPDGGR